MACRMMSATCQRRYQRSLRFLLAAHPEALTQVLAVVQRGISTFVVQHSGLAVSSGARTGAVTLIQRFGSAPNLNPHLHMLFLDGAYVFRGQRPIFHRARRVPQRCRRFDADQPPAPMSWPLSHIHVLRGTGTPVQWMQRLKRVFAMPQGTLS